MRFARRIAAVPLTALVAFAVAATAALAGSGISGVTHHEVKSVAYLNGVACTAPGQCIAVGETPRTTAYPNGEGAIVEISHGRATKTEVDSGAYSLAAIACPTSTTCVAVGSTLSTTGQNGVIVVIKHGHIAKSIAITGDYLGGVGCGSRTVCWATGLPNTGTGSGVLIRVTTGGQHALHKLSFDPYCGEGCSVSPVCSSAAVCLLGGSKKSVYGPAVVAQARNGKITSMHTIKSLDSLSSIACPRAGHCFAVGFGSKGTVERTGVMTVTRGKPGRVRIISKATYVAGLTCVSGSKCIAFGFVPKGHIGKPVTVAILGGRPQRPQQISADVLRASCVRGRCVGVGDTGGTSSTGVLLDFRY